MIERLKEFLDEQEEGLTQQFDDEELSEYINMALDYVETLPIRSEESRDRALLLRGAQFAFQAMAIQYVGDYGKHQYYTQVSDSMGWQIEELLRGKE